MTTTATTIVALRSVVDALKRLEKKKKKKKKTKTKNIRGISMNVFHVRPVPLSYLLR